MCSTSGFVSWTSSIPHVSSAGLLPRSFARSNPPGLALDPIRVHHHRFMWRRISEHTLQHLQKDLLVYDHDDPCPPYRHTRCLWRSSVPFPRTQCSHRLRKGTWVNWRFTFSSTLASGGVVQRRYGPEVCLESVLQALRHSLNTHDSTFCPQSSSRCPSSDPITS